MKQRRMRRGDGPAADGFATPRPPAPARPSALDDATFRALTDAAPVGIYVTDELGDCVWANPSWLKMAGLTLDEALGQGWLRGLHPDDRDTIGERWYRSAESGGSWGFEYRFADGTGTVTWVYGTAAPVYEDGGRLTGYVGANVDISERKAAEEALRAAEERFRTVADFTWGWEYWRDVDHRLIYSSPSCERITGYTPAEYLADAELLTRIVHPDDRPAVFAHLRDRFAMGDEGCHLEFRIITKSGQTRWIGHECRLVFGETGDLRGVRVSNHDITSQREAHERVRAGEELFRGLFDTMTSGCAIYEVHGDGSRGADYIVKDFNATALRLEGKTREEVVGRSLADLRPAIDEYGLIPVFQEVWRTGEPALFPSTFYTDDHYANWYENRVFKLAGGEIVAIYDDVTERQTAQQALTERADEIERQRQFLETLLDTIPNPVFYKDASGRYLGCNTAFTEFLGKDREAIVGKHVHEVSPADLAEKCAETDGELLQGLATQTYEWRVKAADGAARQVIFNKASFPGPNGEVAGLIGVMQDITVRKQAEEAVRESSYVLAMAEQVAHVGSWRYDLATGLTRWSDEMFRLFDWAPADWHGDSWPVLEARVHPDDLPSLEAVAAEATGQTRPIAVEYRLVLGDGSERIVRGEGSVEHDESGRPIALVGYYQDVTERRRSVEQLRAMLQQTVRALGAVGSLRDPYTGDHERRVTLLADAVAAEMGLDDDRREGLRIAGDVHDVGKIGVPTEILSKPGRLSDVEFNLVKQHAQRGYEILQSIDFRWPVAEMVWQHHERLDGSGYPRGLKGEDLLLEARILAVADVVEAMASHRPYRAALGIDAALDEIRGGAGAVYDPDVVAACEKVLASGAFSIDR
jgi:PAS domain S-box-containing protein